MALVFAPASTVSAGGPPQFGANSQSTFENEWSNWSWTEPILDNAEALFLLRTYGEAQVTNSVNAAKAECWSLTKPEGTERYFSFEVDFSECLNVGANGVVDQQDALLWPIAAFEWLNFDGNGNAENLDCLNSSVDVDTAGGLPAVAGFESPLSEMSAESSLGFVDVSSFEFYLLIDFSLIQIQDWLGEDAVWTITVDIDECGGWDGPDIDIEHYRQRASEMTTLPDTQ
jgi:hypothetical protein